MAVLTATDYGELRTKFYRLGFGKDELKALATPPNKTQLMAMLQAIENWFVNGFGTQPTDSLQNDMSTALGQTVPAALAKKIAVAWFDWRKPSLLV